MSSQGRYIFAHTMSPMIPVLMPACLRLASRFGLSDTTAPQFSNMSR